LLTVSTEILVLLLLVVVLAIATTGYVVARGRRAGGRALPPAPAGADRPTLGDVPPPDHDLEEFGTPEVVEPGGVALLERPEAVPGRLVRLRERLARSGALGSRLLAVLSRDHLSEADWEEIEETLLLADVGVAATTELMAELRARVRVLGSRDPASVRAVLRELLLAQVGPDLDRSLHLEQSLDPDGRPHPATVLVVGVNGTGKTTTIGKLARLLVAEDHDVLLGAADTFRAAAADQLETWGARVGVPVVRADREGADPASVAFEAVRAGQEAGADVVVVDTAGRLQNKADLMDELGKIKRVISRRAPGSEVLLVLDATTGQNGMRQAQVFAAVVDVTGLVLTKLDGTAKGGIVVSVQRELGVPVKLVGIGEGPDDLAPFDPASFVDAILT
jgi:fused signal recognition particle receptor